MLVTLLPLYDSGAAELRDGTEVAACSFCRRAIVERKECAEHYASFANSHPRYQQCPFGFTSRSFYFEGKLYVATGIVAYPRFDTNREREMAKKFPTVKVTRKTIEANITVLNSIDEHRAKEIQRASAVIPQAFHELRKLNAAVLQHAEREINTHGDSPNLLSIRSAAELMRNDFDILEALSNIDGMKSLPIDSTINLFDLVYKTKRIFAERAKERRIAIFLDGVRAIIPGSQKSFPIVPAVLVENAIKYAPRGSQVRLEVSAREGRAMLTVENQYEGIIDVERCFERGARFSADVEGGGFGLYLAREVVSCHRGVIACDYSGGIVRMTVNLPLVSVID